jgi:hypothetical protein
VHITLLGTGTPGPSLARQSSGYLVDVGGDVLVRARRDAAAAASAAAGDGRARREVVTGRDWKVTAGHAAHVQPQLECLAYRISSFRRSGRSASMNLTMSRAISSAACPRPRRIRLRLRPRE